jgi:hypothetical protein
MLLYTRQHGQNQMLITSKFCVVAIFVIVDFQIIFNVTIFCFWSVACKSTVTSELTVLHLEIMKTSFFYFFLSHGKWLWWEFVFDRCICLVFLQLPSTAYFEDCV